jgi:hypothetical protein
MSKDQISNALFDLYDIRNALPKKVKQMPKDTEGADFTIGELLDDVIEWLEEIDQCST